jgi:ribonuclease BN (tRNA processing enzyme)
MDPVTCCRSIPDRKAGSMTITILGNNGPFPDAGNACSGYLLADGTTRILLDCGSGVLSNLFRHTGFESLDAIILTHLHSDHISDMHVLRYAVQTGKNRGSFAGVIPVWASPKPEEQYRLMDTPEYFLLQPLADGLVLDIGTIRLHFAAMPHAVPSFAVRAESGGRIFAYGSDTGPNDGLTPFLAGVHLGLLHAGLMSRDIRPGVRNHLSAADCGRFALESGIGKLLISHRTPGYSEEEMVNEAKGFFLKTGFARLNETYDV